MLTTAVVRSGLASVTHDETRVKLSCFHSCHPFQKGSLLWRRDDQSVVACAFASMPLCGSKKIAEPMPLVGIRLGKEMYEGEA